VRLAIACLLPVLALAGQSGTPPSGATAGTASLIGRVVAADTGQPVRSAGVRVETTGLSWTATTDDDGRFAVPNLPGGRYTLRVTKAGFVTWLYGRDPVGAFSRAEPVEIRDGDRVDRGVLRLPRGGVIAGRVVDAFGDPVIEMDVRALRHEYLAPGEPRLGYVRHASTNDLGEFRIYGLPPGRYFVGIGLSTAGVADRARQSTDTLHVVPAPRGVAPVFYPGTPLASDATPVVVPAGAEIRGIDIRLQTVPLATLSGIVTNARGEPASGVILMLNPARTDGVLFAFPSFVEPDAAGRFRMVNIPPGDYRIDVVSRARMEAIGRTGTNLARGPADEIASVAVSVAGQDIEGIAVRTGRGFNLEGRLVVEGGAALPQESKISIAAIPTLSRQGLTGTFLSGSGDVEPDGRFAIEGIAGGVVIRVHGLPAGWSQKAVRLHGTDVTDEGLDVRGSLQGLEIDVTPTPTRVAGTVRDGAGALVRDYAAVVVFPADRRRWTTRLTRYVTSAKPDADGQFAVTGLPPGTYYAAVVDTLESDWPSPDSLERLRQNATSFSLADGERRTLALVRR